VNNIPDKPEVHKMVVYTGSADVRVITKEDLRQNQDVDGPDLMVWDYRNGWMLDAAGLSDEVLTYFDVDDDDFVVLDSDVKKFEQLTALHRSRRRATGFSGRLLGNVARARGEVAKDKVILGHTGPASVPGVTDTREAGALPMFEEPVSGQPRTADAVKP
jgi:hypothetical protein